MYQAWNFKAEPSLSLAWILHSMSTRAGAWLRFHSCPLIRAWQKNLQPWAGSSSLVLSGTKLIFFGSHLYSLVLSGSPQHIDQSCQWPRSFHLAPTTSYISYWRGPRPIWIIPPPPLHCCLLNWGRECRILQYPPFLIQPLCCRKLHILHHNIQRKQG